jgi:hypothetical protein
MDDGEYPMDKEEFLKLEHSTLLEEFKAARDTMLFEIGVSKRVVTITLSAAGILLAITPYIVQSNLPILFLIAPIVFYPLAWSQIRSLFLSNTLGEYLLLVLIPHIQSTLKELSPDKSIDFSYIMGMEAYFGAADRRNRLILLPIQAGNYGINLISAIFSICAYFAMIYHKQQSISTLDWLLIALNTILFCYTTFLGVWSRFSTDTSKLSEALWLEKSGRNEKQ